MSRTILDLAPWLVPLMQGRGLDAERAVIESDADFFATTKSPDGPERRDN